MWGLFGGRAWHHSSRGFGEVYFGSDGQPAGRDARGADRDDHKLAEDVEDRKKHHPKSGFGTDSATTFGKVLQNLKRNTHTFMRKATIEFASFLYRGLRFRASIYAVWSSPRLICFFRTFAVSIGGARWSR